MQVNVTEKEPVTRVPRREMTSKLLDLDSLPFDQTYTCKNGDVIDLPTVVGNHQPVIEAMANIGLVKWNESFGFAMAAPQVGTRFVIDNWNHPEDFVWFIGGWGPKRGMYIANAVRELRPMLREMAPSSLHLRLIHPDRFEDVVDSPEENSVTFQWGDFPWAGAVLLELGHLKLAGAVNGLAEVQNDTAARMILGCVGDQIIEGDRILPDAA